MRFSHRVAAGFALVSCTAWLTGCVEVDPRREKAPGPATGTEAVTLPVPLDGSKGAWSVVNTAEAQGERTLDFVPNGQTIKNWTELVTFQTFNKQSPQRRESLDAFLSTERAEIEQACPGSSVEVLAERTDGVLYASRLEDCPDRPAELIGRVIDGQENRFVLRYFVRGKLRMTTERRQAWFNRLERVQLLRLPQR